MSMLVNPFVFGGGGGGGGVPGVATDIIFVDGCDHITTSNDKWPESGGSFFPSIASSASGAHGRYYDCSTNAATKDLGQNLVSISAGIRLMSQTDVTSNVLLFNDSSTNQLNLQYVTGGAFAIRRNTTVLATGTFTTSLNTWYYVTLSATIDNTTGSVTARIYDDSGILQDTITFSGDTQNSANAFANRVIIGGSANDALIDDIWIASANANYGSLRVETVYPAGNGSSNPFSRQGADSGANWSQVDEAQNNDLTDYVQSGLSVGEVELFTFASRVLTGAIHAIQASLIGQRSAASTCTVRAITRLSGANHVGSTQSVDNSFQINWHAWGVNPATAAAWDSSDLATAEFGVERVAFAAGIRYNLTQVVLEIVTAL